MLPDKELGEQIVELKKEILSIETQINVLKMKLHDKKISLNNLEELVEMRRTVFDT